MSSPSNLLRNQRNREKSNKGNPHTLASSKKNRARARNIARQLRRNNSPATVAARAAKLKRGGVVNYAAVALAVTELKNSALRLQSPPARAQPVQSVPPCVTVANNLEN